MKKPKPPRKPVTQSDLRAKALEIEREAASLSEVLGARRAEPQTRDEAVVAMADLLKASRKPDDAIESMIKIAGEVRPRISTERARHLVQEFARAFGFAVEPTPISSKVLH